MKNRQLLMAVREFYVKKNYSVVEFLNINGNAVLQASATEQMRTPLLWVTTQRVVSISYRRSGTTYRSHLQVSRNFGKKFTTTRCVITEKSSVLINGNVQ